MRELEKGILARIGDKFLSELEEIKAERIKKGVDKKKRSIKKLTNLITRHRDWVKIKEDTIEINLGGQDDKK